MRRGHTSTIRASHPALGSLPRLQPSLVAFLAITIVAISPVGQFLDTTLHQRWITKRDNPALREFLLDGPDRLASQAFAGTLLLLVALWFAWRWRTIAPMLIAGLAECGFLATGLIKLALAKDATTFGLPLWWDGGFGEHGAHGMAYPSGHAAESVLLYGAIIVILYRYGPPLASRHLRLMRLAWKLIIVNTVAVSWLLGTHWVSDLAGGVAFGVLALRIVVVLVERGHVDALALTARPRGRRARRSASPPPPRP